MTSIEQFIRNKIVTSSSDVIEFCVQELNLKEDVARKIIQRLPDSIYRYKGICSSKQSILYHKDDWMIEGFTEAIIAVLRKYAKQHYIVIKALEMHDGYVPIDKLASYSISPVELIKGHKSFDSVILDLKTLHLIGEDDNSYILNSDTANQRRSKAKNLIHNITLEHFNNWARNIGLISYSSTKYNSTCSRYQFSLVAPSYIRTLTCKSNGGKIVPAFVVADILMGDLDEDAILFFTHKLSNMVGLNYNSKYLPFFITDSHDASIYKTLKEAGVVIGNVDELFGEQYSSTIKGILNLMENAGAILKTNPEQYLSLLANIEKLAIGKTNNLKGDLFEMTVGYYHGQICQSLEIGKNVYYEQEHREIDVFALYHNKVVVAECKGYNKKLDDSYIDCWLSNKIPVIRNWILNQDSLKNKKICFELWSTGGFEESALKKLQDSSAKTKKYDIEYFAYQDMLELAKNNNVMHFQKLLKTYYYKELM